MDTRVAEFDYKGRDCSNLISYKYGDGQHACADIHVVHDMGQNRHRCQIDGNTYIWEPLEPSNIVLVMSQGLNKRVALLAYFEARVQRSGSYPGGLRQQRGEDVGEIHIMDDCGEGEAMTEKTLYTAVVVVERAKRWTKTR